MSGSDAYFANPDYFEPLVLALTQGTFESPKDGRPLVIQLGVKITERVDALIDNGGFRDPHMAYAAMTALELVAGLHPDLFLEHIRQSLGGLSYSGLLNGQNKIVARFWKNYFREHPSVEGSWADRLQAALSDRRLSSKLTDYVAIQHRGEGHRNAIEYLNQHYPRMGFFARRLGGFDVDRLLAES